MHIGLAGPDVEEAAAPAVQNIAAAVQRVLTGQGRTPETDAADCTGAAAPSVC